LKFQKKRKKIKVTIILKKKINRILRQEPVENLFSFICSSNNNISRITKMIEKLCSSYGNKIAEIEGKEYFSFPAIEKLSGDNIEKELREAGFGYRAKYISDTAKYLQENQIDEAKLRTYRKETYQTTKDFLLKLSGVGPKVADCICLMSMDKLEAVPIDTHVFRYSMRDYKFMNQGGSKLKTKASFSKIDYQQLGDYFRDLHGPFAGWAQSVSFYFILFYFILFYLFYLFLFFFILISFSFSFSLLFFCFLSFSLLFFHFV